MYDKIINALPMVLLCVSTMSVTAYGKERTENYCDNQAEKKEFEDLLSKYPKDIGIIRLIALRQGLCEMIDKQQISLATGMDLWTIERQKILTERTKAELNRMTKKKP